MNHMQKLVGIILFFVSVFPLQAQDNLCRTDTEGLSYHLERAGWLRGQGKFRESLEHYNCALQIDPTSETAYRGRGVNYERLGQYRLGLADLERAMELVPDDPNVNLNFGWVNYKLGNLETAIASYTRAIEYDPEYARAYNNRAVAYRQIGHLDAAIADFEEAINLHHEPLASPVLGLAHVYTELGDLDKAADYYAQAEALQPQIEVPSEIQTYIQIEGLREILIRYLPILLFIGITLTWLLMLVRRLWQRFRAQP